MSRDSWDDSYSEGSYEDEPDGEAAGPQPGDLDGSDSDDYETVPCPHCGHEISELAERCPYCGDWIVPGGALGRKRRWPWLLVAILLLILVLIWTL